MFFGYEDSNVIAQFRSVEQLFIVSQIVGYQSFLSLSVLLESVNKLFTSYTELLVGGCHSDGYAHKHSLKCCFSQLYAADGVINYGYFNVNCM